MKDVPVPSSYDDLMPEDDLLPEDAVQLEFDFGSDPDVPPGFADRVAALKRQMEVLVRRANVALGDHKVALAVDPEDGTLAFSHDGVSPAVSEALDAVNAAIRDADAAGVSFFVYPSGVGLVVAGSAARYGAFLDRG